MIATEISVLVGMVLRECSELETVSTVTVCHMFELIVCKHGMHPCMCMWPTQYMSSRPLALARLVFASAVSTIKPACRPCSSVYHVC
jgi:hypothetical protein